MVAVIQVNLSKYTEITTLKSTYFSDQTLSELLQAFMSTDTDIVRW